MIEDLLTTLHQLDVKVRLENGELRLNAPKGALTPPLIAQLREKKADLIAFLVGMESLQARKAAPIEVVSRDQPIPLSHAQYRLWFISNLERHSTAYIIPFALTLTGPLSIKSLEAAISAIIERHESLRTVFPMGPDGPLQQIREVVPFDLPLIDLTTVPSTERQATLEHFLEHEATSTLNLEEGPLFRPLLIRLETDHHALSLTTHHIISDGWSQQILTRELVTFYTAFAQGTAPQVAPLEIQYADFSVWQRTWLDGPVQERQLAYWRNRLQGVADLLPLPKDHPHLPIQSFVGEAVYFRIEEQQFRVLSALVKQTQTTLFAVLEAAFAALLFRYTGRNDILIGSPNANRSRRDIEPLIGFFVNTLILRNQPSGDLSFADFLDRTKAMLLDAFDHQDVPLEHVVETLQLERNLSYNTLFQAVFALNSLVSPIQLPSLKISPLSFAVKTSKFELSLALAEQDRGMIGSIVYNSDLFERATAERMVDHYQNLLLDVLKDPTLELSRLNLLSEAERRALLLAQSDAAQARPISSLLAPAQLVNYSKGRQAWDQRVLHRRVAYLIHQMQDIKIAEKAVVVCLSQHPADFLVALIAVLDSGRMFLPLPPGAWDAYALEADEVHLLLAENETSIPLGYTGPILYLDTPVEDRPTAPTRLAESALLMPELAGSGRAKIFQISTPAFLRQVEKLCRSWTLAKDQVLLLDGPVWTPRNLLSTCVALSSGAYLVCAQDEDLACALHDESVTAWYTTGERAGEVIGEMPSGHLPALTHLTLDCFGFPAAFAREHVRRINPATRINNLRSWPEAGGPAFLFDAEPCDARDLIRARPWIGQARVLDEHGNLQPFGVFGELALMGDHLAEAYWRQEALTSARFVTSPLDGTRQFMTGLRACSLEDGGYHLLGPAQSEIVHRGAAFMPALLEAQISARPGTKDCHIGRVENLDNKPLLIAWVACEHQDEDTLSRDLATTLPGYMVPDLVVPSATLGRRADGFLEYGKLPLPKTISTSESITTASPVEEILAHIWSRALGREITDLGADFFDLGGQSLTATKVVSGIGEYFGVTLPLKTMFTASSIRKLSKELDRMLREDSNAALAPIEPREQKEQAPLSFAQQRLWFLHQFGNKTLYNIPLHLHLRGSLNFSAMAQALSAIVARHGSLRTVFREEDGTAFQQLLPQVALEPRYVDLSLLTGPKQSEEIERLRAAETAQAFDLENGPLFSVLLLRLEPDHHLLLLTMHHIISDAWSLGVLMHEMNACYNAYVLGEPPRLTPLPIQYADFAAWQRQHLAPALETQKLWWQGYLQDAPAILELPTDRSRPALQTHQGALLPFVFEEQLHLRIRQFCRDTGTTLFMLSQAAFGLMLARYSGQSDLTIGSPIANRNRPHLEALIGFFVNTLVFRLKLARTQGFAGFLADIRKRSLEIYAHQDLPFEHVVEMLKPERDLSRSPLFQAMLLVQHASADSLSLSGLEVHSPDPRAATAKFDITLNISETRKGLQGAVIYNSDLFDRDTIARMVRHMLHLLEEGMKAPNLAMERLPFCDANALRHMLVTPNTSVHMETPGVYSRFLQQVEAQPESPALVFEDDDGLLRTWSYLELHQESCQLAQQLAQKGVVFGDRVGICVARSPLMIRSLLACLRLGAAYVPVDSESPPQRRAYLLKNAALKLLIGEASFGAPDETSEKLYLSLETRPERSGPTPDVAEIVAYHPLNIAYVIYTSGSTGQPKGVAISHGALANYSAGIIERLKARPGQSYAMVSTLAADLGLTMLYGALASGGTLHLFTREAVGSAARFSAYFKRHRIDYLKIVPSHLLALQSVDGPPVLPRTCLVLGGEPSRRDWVESLADQDPNCRIMNHYGPTEATVGMLTYVFDRACPPLAALPLEQRLPAMRAYVLDKLLHPLPFGVKGELLIGGAGLAQGYSGRPGLTASSFVPDAMAALDPSIPPGTRLYKTGDAARAGENGRIELLGRTDDQLKIRGYRVEPGEVGAALLALDEIEQCLVLPQKDEIGILKLTAYVHLCGEAIADEPVLLYQDHALFQTLRRSLRLGLPEYMIPSEFIVMPQMPLNLNGKIDRSALPRLARMYRPAAAAHVPAVTAEEEKMVEIWRKLLRVEDLGMNDNFFDLGGHSLLITQLISQIRKEFKVEITLRYIFEEPTPAGLCEFVNSVNWALGEELPLCVGTDQEYEGGEI